MVAPADGLSVFDLELAKHRGWMLARARKLLNGDVDEAEDAVQDAFLSLHRYRDQVRGDLSSWLATVLRNRCVDRIRAGRKEPLAEDLQVGSVVARATDVTELAQPLRVCTCCGRDLPLTPAHFNSRGGGKRHHECRSCAARHLKIARLNKELHGKPILGDAARLKTLAEVERRHIERAVRLCGSVARAAAQIQVTRDTIRRRMHEYAKLPPLEIRVRTRHDLQCTLDRLLAEEKEARRRAP